MDSFDNMLKDYKSLECSGCDQHFGFESRWDASVRLCSHDCLEIFNVKSRTRSLPRMRYNSFSSSAGTLTESNSNYHQGIPQQQQHGGTSSLCYGLPTPPPQPLFGAYVMQPPHGVFVASGGRVPGPTQYSGGQPFAFTAFTPGAQPHYVQSLQSGERGRPRFRTKTGEGAFTPNNFNQEQPNTETLLKVYVKDSPNEEKQLTGTVQETTATPVRVETPIESLAKKLKEAIQMQEPIKAVEEKIPQPVTVDVADSGVVGDKERRSFISSAVRALVKHPAVQCNEDTSLVPPPPADDYVKKSTKTVPPEFLEEAAGDVTASKSKVTGSDTDLKKKKRMTESPFILKSAVAEPVKKVTIVDGKDEKEKLFRVESRNADNDDDWRLKAGKNLQKDEERKGWRENELRDAGASLWLTKQDHPPRPVSPLVGAPNSSGSKSAPTATAVKKDVVSAAAGKKPGFKFQELELSANITNHKLGVSIAFVWDNLELTLNSCADQPSIKKMQDQIDKYCGKSPVMQREPQIGDIVFANYHGEFYRAVVMSVSSADKTFNVDFIDYGDTLEVFLTDLREPDAGIMKQHPLYGLRFGLAPLSKEAKQMRKCDLPEKFFDWVEICEFFIEVKSVLGYHKWDGKLHLGANKSDGTLNDVIEDPDILKKGLICKPGAKKPAPEDNIIPEMKSVPKKDDAKDRISRQRPEMGKPPITGNVKPSATVNTVTPSGITKSNPVTKSSATVKPTKSAEKAEASKQSLSQLPVAPPKKVVVPPPSKPAIPVATVPGKVNVSGVIPAATSTETPPKVTEDFYCKLAMDSAKWSENFVHGGQVKISYVWNPRELTINSLDDQERLQRVDGLIKIWTQTAPALTSMPWIDDIILAQYSNGEYYRAVVKQARNDEVNVHFLDYGDQITAPISKCKPLSPELQEMPILGLQLTVDGLPDNVGEIHDERLDKAVDAKMQLEKLGEITRGRWKGRLWIDAYEHWGGIVAEILEEREGKAAM